MTKCCLAVILYICIRHWRIAMLLERVSLTRLSRMLQIWLIATIRGSTSLLKVIVYIPSTLLIWHSYLSHCNVAEMKKMILSKGDHIQTWFNDFKQFRVEKVKRQKRKARKLLLAKRTAESVVEESKRKREDSTAGRQPSSSNPSPSSGNVDRNENNDTCAIQPTPKRKSAAKPPPRKNPPRHGGQKK